MTAPGAQPPVPAPGEGATVPDYEAMVVAEAQQPLLDAAQVLRDYDIGLDEDKMNVVLSVLAGDARRRYRSAPEVYAARAQALGGITVGSEADGAAAQPNPEAVGEPEADPVSFASRIALSFMYFKSNGGIVPGANPRWEALEKGHAAPNIPSNIDPTELVVDDLVHESAVAVIARDARGRVVEADTVFKEEKPKADGDAEDLDAPSKKADKVKGDAIPETALVAELAYVAGSNNGELFRVSAFLSQDELYQLQDILDENPRFLREVILSTMPPKMRAHAEAWFARIDKGRSVLRFLDRTTDDEAEDYEIEPVEQA